MPQTHINIGNAFSVLLLVTKQMHVFLNSSSLIYAV